MVKYQELKIRKSRLGKTVYATRLLSDKPVRILTTYTAIAYERLDNVAYKFYGDPKYWYVIARANNLSNGVFHAPPGITLIIPEL